MEITEQIHASPLFFEIEDKEIDYFLKQCRISSIDEGSYIYKQGDESKEFFFLLEGKVLLEKSSFKSNIRIGELKSGDIFGVGVFSDEKSRNSAAKALVASYILNVNYDVLQKMYQKKPDLFAILMVNISRLLAKGLEYANSTIYNIAELSELTNGSKEQSPLLESKKPVVFVIEDDGDIREAAYQYLRNDFSVQIFNNPMEVMNLVENKNIPDIFVTDFMMPEMNGVEFVQFLKEESVKKPVIFVTGINQFDMAREALNLGVFSLVEKPFTAEQLVHVVKGALKQDFLEDFNKLLLSSYEVLFANLTTILKSLDQENSLTKIHELITDTSKQYQMLANKKLTLKSFE